MTQISPTVAAALAVLAAYLIGSIPFGYVIARTVRGIDIRTVGSGNLGATNVGRVLGRRYFFIVLALDLLKGLLPTIGLPRLVGRLAGEVPVDLPVLVALAAILGHTFPVYLKFRGGKGVATSLGVVLALDPASCAVAVLVFGVVLVISRYMSLASLVGGGGFVAARFVRTPAPWSREHIAMSLFSIAVVALLVVRHRSNLARIRAGTESRVNLGRSKKPSGGPSNGCSGRVGLFLVIGLAVLVCVIASGTWLVRNAARTVEAEAGPWSLRETDRVTTGQQRVDRVAFAHGGDRLAGICPRYNRLLIYQVNAASKLHDVAETQLEGRPVGVVTLGPWFAVLERPAGDAKHLEPGWWEVFDREGQRVGSRRLAGFYPDDLAASPDGRLLFVLCSGRSEGDEKKPLASLDVIAIDPITAASRPLGRVTFDASDDPERLTVSASARYAAVLLAKSRRTAAVDVSDPSAPRLIGRTPASTADAPYVSVSEGSDWIMMPGGSDGDTIALEAPRTASQPARRRTGQGVRTPTTWSPRVKRTRRWISSRRGRSTRSAASPCSGRLTWAARDRPASRTRPNGTSSPSPRAPAASMSSRCGRVEVAGGDCSVESGKLGGSSTRPRYWLDDMHQETPTTLKNVARFCPDCGHARESADGGLCDRCGSSLVIQGYCPICESRLRRAVGDLCPKHDVKLLADDSFEARPRLAAGAPIAWVTVKRFPDSLAVAAARIRLEAEGIPTFVEGERMGAPSMYRVATGGVKLQVPAELTAEARIILDQAWSWPDDELGLEEEPAEELADAPHEAESTRTFVIELIVVLALAIPLIAWLVAHLRAG